MLTDLYQLTMMYGYFKCGQRMRIPPCSNVFYRKTAGDSGYAIMAGLEQVIDFINDLHFGKEDIDYLRTLNLFDEDFFDSLSKFSFTGEIYAVPEGTVVFPMEPLIRVKAKLAEAQLIETAMLNIVNHQTLIATKASRVVYAADGGGVLEFGLRRAQGPDAGIYGARAAVIGGCVATSNVLTGQMFDVGVAGTHAHSWIMSFPTEEDAFRAYAEIFPDACLLLVDTYDTLESGVPNAIKIFGELRAKGYEPQGIRLDSGDLAYLSKRARQMLDEAGYPDAKICASSDLDEQIIRELNQQGARIDTWGVGTKLITSENCPALGGVYKLSAIEENGKLVPKIKISENIWKITNPGYKKIVRIYSNSTGKAIADLIMLAEEKIDENEPLTIFDPIETWKRMTVSNFHIKELLVPFSQMANGLQLALRQGDTGVFQLDLDTFWNEYRRFTRPHIYKVDLSDKLYELKKGSFFLRRRSRRSWTPLRFKL